MKLFLFTTFTLANLFTPLAHAIDFVESYQMAIQNDSKLKATEQRKIGISEERAKALSGYYPKVQLSLSKGRGETNAETGNFLSSGNRSYDTKNYNLSLRQPLFNKSLSADYDKAMANIEIQNSNYDAENNNLVSRLTERYLNVLFAQDTLDFDMVRETTLNDALVQSKKRFQAGLGIKNDINEIYAELEVVGANLIDDKNRLIASKRALENLLGAYPTELARIDFEKINTQPLDQSSLSNLLAQAKENNAELAAAKHQISLMTSEYDKNKAAHYPTVDLQLTRSYTESESNITIGSAFNTKAIAVQVNVPIYSGGFTSASTRQSAAFIEEAKENLNQKSKEISEKVVDAFNGINNSLALIQAYDRSLKANNDVVEGTKKAFLAGTRTNVDVLTALEKRDQAKLNYAKSVYSYLLNSVQLKELTSQINIQDIEYLNSLKLNGNTQSNFKLD